MRTAALVLAVGLIAVACVGPTKGPGEALCGNLCSRCHGADLAGTPTAPSLRGLERHWEREPLIRYLKDPVGERRGDPRLESQAARHLIDMPAYDELSDEQLEDVVSFLLHEKGAR